MVAEALYKISYERIRLELGFVWALSRNSSTYKDNFIVKVSTLNGTGWGEVAPNIRYGEEPDIIEQKLVELAAQGLTLARCRSIITDYSVEASLRCGLSCALQMAIQDSWPLQSFPVEGVPCSFTLPIMEAGEVEPFFIKWGLSRFSALKVKVGRGDNTQMIKALGRLYQGPVWVDANEGYRSLPALDADVATWQQHVQLVVVEQPFPADNLSLAFGLKNRYPGIAVLADEALATEFEVSALVDYYDGINIKLQKAGDIANAYQQFTEANSLGMKVMVGCMVETSIGIAHAMPLALQADFCDLDSMLYLTHEPYGWVREQGGRLYAGVQP